MIAPGAGVPVYLACGATDMRKGIEGLAAHAQLVLKQNPASGAVFAFRGRRGDRLKLLFWDGQGFYLFWRQHPKTTPDQRLELGPPTMMHNAG
jgi:transposase